MTASISSETTNEYAQALGPVAVAKQNQLEELRQLILAPYLYEMSKLQAQVKNLEQQVAQHEELLDNLGPLVAEAVDKALRDFQNELTETIAPVLAPAIKTQVKVAREDIIDALYPVIGSTITRSITEAVRGLVESIDQNLKKSFSISGRFKRKVKSKVSGVSEGAIALRDALPFTVTEIFLIHTESGLLISHVHPTPLLASENQTAATGEDDASMGEDRDLVSGMLTAIRDFVRESFKGQIGTNEYSQLNQIQYGGLTILLEPSRYAYLAVVYSGAAPINYSNRVREVLNWLHSGYAQQLRTFGENGDSTRLAKVGDLLYSLVANSN